MNDNMYNNYEDDMEIDLVDLLFYLLKKWRSLIVAIVIGAILGAGLYVVKNHQQQAAQEAELLKNDEDEAFDEKDYNISKDTKVNMDIAYQYRQLYNKQLEYNQKSIIMQLDPNEVYAGVLEYYISAGNNTGLLNELYQSILNDDDILEELKDASGLKCETPYIKELISSEDGDDKNIAINVNSNGENVEKHSFVTYKVVSTDQKSCEKMLQVLRERVEALQAEYEETYGAYGVSEVSSAISQVTDTTYLNAQRENVDRLNNYLATMKNAESSFSDDEKTYYTNKYLAKEYVNSDNAEEAKAVLLEEAEPVSKAKWLAIGVIFLVMIWGAYYVVRYLLDSRVKTVSELQNTYHLPVIGIVQTASNNSKGLDKMLDHLYQNTKQKPDTLEYVIQAINAMQTEKSILCGDTEILEVKKLMEELSDSCEHMKTGDFISKNIESLEHAKAVGNEILVVRVDKNSRKEIEREMESCRLQKIDILGVVVVE